MKLVRYNRGYTLFLSEHEMQVLQVLIAGNHDRAERLTTGQRRSYWRRITRQQLPLLRVDDDRRSGEHKED